MKSFDYSREELYEFIGEFMAKLKFKPTLIRVGTYELHLENQHCFLTFFTERYYESLALIMTDKKAGEKYSYPELFSAKGNPAIVDVEEHEEILISKLKIVITFLEEYMALELNGDFSNV